MPPPRAGRSGRRRAWLRRRARARGTAGRVEVGGGIFFSRESDESGEGVVEAETPVIYIPYCCYCTKASSLR